MVGNNNWRSLLNNVYALTLYNIAGLSAFLKRELFGRFDPHQKAFISGSFVLTSDNQIMTALIKYDLLFKL